MNALKKNINRLLTLNFKLKRNQSNNIALLIRDDGIGDFLLFSGLLPLYRRFFLEKGLEIFLLVRKEIVELAKLYLPESRIIVMDKKAYYYDLSYRKNFLQSLMQLSPKYIVSSIHRSSEGDDIVRFIGRNRITIGYEGEILLKKKKKKLYTHLIPSFDRIKIPSKYKYNHVILHERFYYSQISQRKVSTSECKPFIDIVAGHPFIKTDYFTCIVGAGSFKRVYPIEKQAKVLTFLLANTNYKCLLLGGKGEALIANKIIAHLPSYLKSRILNLVSKTTLLESLILIKNGKLTIGNETGLVHASWIMEVPTIVIYGGGHFGRFLPLNSYGKVVYKRLECFCCNWKCHYKEIPVRCIAGIEESKIYQFIEKLIDN